MYRSHVLVCGGTGCTSSDSEQIIETLERRNCKASGLENEVNVVRTGCFGLCALGPIMIVYPEGCLLQHGEGRGRSGDRGRASAQGQNRQAPAVSGDRGRRTTRSSP